MGSTTLRTQSLGSFDSTGSPRHFEGGCEGSRREEGKIRRVLIVDDDAAIRMVCAISLQAEGLDVLEAADEARAAGDDQVTGRLFENFVAMEIARLLDWAETSATQYHYRDRSSGDEIDTVLESRAGEIACVECKAAATVTSADYRAIAKLRDARGDQFVAGAVIYAGAETRPLTEKIWAIPVSALWGAADPLVTTILTPGSTAVTDRRRAGTRRRTTR